MDDKARVLVGAERTKAYQELMKVLYDEVAVVPIVHPAISYAVSNKLNWEPRLDGFIMVKEMSFKQ